MILLLALLAHAADVHSEAHRAHEPGDPLLTLRGGPLSEPVVVPLWLSLAQPDPDMKCAMHHEVAWLVWPDGRVYAQQYNSWCSVDGARCKLYDGAWKAPPGGCITGWPGIHFRFERLSDDVFAVRADSEGAGEVIVVRWTPEAGPTRLFSFPTGNTGRAELRMVDDQVLVDSPCDLEAGGCRFGRDHGEVDSRTWRWDGEGFVSSPR